MQITLESLGLSKEDIQERVIDRLCEQVLSGKTFDEDGNEEWVDSQFKRKLDEKIKEQINAGISAIAEKHILPNVSTYIENLTLQETNRWGEKAGKPITFIEYLVQRAEAYIKEDVNHEGKSQSENGGYSWNKNTTRIAYLINSHLQYHITTAMKSALQTANSAIVGGIEKAVKIQLEQIVNGLKVAVQTK